MIKGVLAGQNACCLLVFALARSPAFWELGDGHRVFTNWWQLASYHMSSGRKK